MTAYTRVAVVDDDAHIRAAARAILSLLGYRVSVFATASDALLAMRRERFDAAVVDFDVAHREGIDLAEAICATAELDDVALVGVAFDLARIDLELVDRAIQKPYAVEQLGAEVRQAIDRARAITQGARPARPA